jgi:hypothetical protein
MPLVAYSDVTLDYAIISLNSGTDELRILLGCEDVFDFQSGRHCRNNVKLQHCRVLRYWFERSKQIKVHGRTITDWLRCDHVRLDAHPCAWNARSGFDVPAGCLAVVACTDIRQALEHSQCCCQGPIPTPQFQAISKCVSTLQLLGRPSDDGGPEWRQNVFPRFPRLEAHRRKRAPPVSNKPRVEGSGITLAVIANCRTCGPSPLVQLIPSEEV